MDVLHAVALELRELECMMDYFGAAQYLVLDSPLIPSTYASFNAILLGMSATDGKANTCGLSELLRHQR
jgi:hypothetical protein